MKEQFVTYKIARNLKDLGFNQPCVARFNRGKQFEMNVLGNWYKHNTGEVKGSFLSAPLWQQAIEFFKEEYKFFSFIDTYPTAENPYRCFYVIRFIEIDKESFFSGWFDTYNDALENLMSKLIDLGLKQTK